MTASELAVILGKHLGEILLDASTKVEQKPGVNETAVITAFLHGGQEFQITVQQTA